MLAHRFERSNRVAETLAVFNGPMLRFVSFARSMKPFFSQSPQFSLLIAFLLFAFALSAGTISVHAQEEDVEAQAIAMFTQGQDAHEKGDFKAAIDFYDKALKFIPEFPEAELQRGNAFISLGRLDDAETAYRHAVEIRSDWSLALAALGDVLVRRAKYQEAEPILLKAIELDDLNYPAFTALTDLKLRTSAESAERTRLLAKLRILTSKARPTPAIWAARGALENSLGDTTSAKESLKAALALDPKNPAALYESAFVALNANDPGQAAAYIARLDAVSPNSTGVKILQARMLYATGDIDGALKQLEELANTSPVAAALAKEIVANNTADPAELEKQLVADPKNQILLRNLCSSYRIKDPSKALEYCRQAVAADPTRIENAIGFGGALIQAKRFDEAIVLFKKLVVTAPDNSTIRANLATALFFSRKYAEAKPEYRWLTEHQPNLAAAYYFLALTHDQLGEFADAMANYQQFLRLADKKSSEEVEKVNLRLPGLQKQLRSGKGKRSN
jgi:tetratricopeptide (TPR) repeat protein